MPSTMLNCPCVDELTGVIESDGCIEGYLDCDAELAGEIINISYANDHSALRNRDLPDQHPISAITGLQEELDAKIGGLGTTIIYCGTSTEVIDGV